MFELVLVFLTDNAVALGGGAAAIGIVEYMFSPFKSLRNKVRGPEKVTIANLDELVPKAGLPVAPSEPVVTLTLQQLEYSIALKISEAEINLQSAHDDEKANLRNQIAELRRRASDPESALKEARKTIAKLEQALEREGNEIGADRLAKAKTALEAGDFSLADELFAQIEAHEDLAVSRAARAAFARGEIAEQEVRWGDAARHYGKAARLERSYVHLYSAREFSWRSGDYETALVLGKALLVCAEKVHGKDSTEFATALNEHAQSLWSAGRYGEAEPLLRQAVEIDKRTLSEEHPSYARDLNNLAALLQEMGQYVEAEPLLRQAIVIAKRTMSKEHPNYACGLSNLAGLLLGMGRYGEAEPLYRQAMKIDKKTLGDEHPSYATDLNNLAELLQDMGRYVEAEPLFRQAVAIFEAALGGEHPDTISGKRNYELFLAAREAADKSDS